MKKTPLLFIALLISSCAVHHKIKLDSRFSYDFVEKIKKMNYSIKRNSKITSHPDNVKITSAVRNEHLMGRGNIYQLDSGKIFNDMLYQASSHAGYLCKTKCSNIVVKLYDIKFKIAQGDYVGKSVFGIDHADVAMKVSIEINDSKIIKNYKVKISSSDDLPALTRLFPVQLHLMEQVIFILMNDIEGMVKA